MSAFLVRIGMSYPLVERTLDKNVFGLLQRQFPEEACVEVLSNRYTFGLLRMNAASAAECREAVNKAWTDEFDEPADSLSMLITPDNGDDTGVLMRSIYSSSLSGLSFMSFERGVPSALSIIIAHAPSISGTAHTP